MTLFNSLKDTTLCTYSDMGIVIFYKEPTHIQDGNIHFTEESLKRFRYDVFQINKFFPTNYTREQVQKYLERLLALIGWEEYECISEASLYTKSDFYVGRAIIAYVRSRR